MFSKGPCHSRVACPIKSVGFCPRGQFRVKATSGFPVSSKPSTPRPPSENRHVLEAVGFQGRFEICWNREVHALPPQLDCLCLNKPRAAVQSSPFHFPRPGSSRPALGKQLSRFVLPFYPPCQPPNLFHQASLSSRTVLASASILTVGSIAWYTHLYGSLPFVGEVYANSPAEDGLHPTSYPWSQNGWFDTFDHAR